MKVLTERFRVRFIDTFNYLSASLAKLASTVTNFKYAPENANMKAPFPYEWFDCIDKLQGPLPMQEEAWYSNFQGALQDKMQLGFSILELAKIEVYKFFYAVKSKFGENVQLLYHDTDSLVMFFDACHTHPLVTMVNDPLLRPCLDFEKVPDNYVIRTENTDKVPGLWADEVGHRTILEFVGLRAKTYALRFADGDSLMKNKGITRSAYVDDTRRRITFEDYKKCLFENELLYVQQYLIRSHQHTIYSTKQRKLALISEDRKRKVLSDRVSTIPHGYKEENEENEEEVQRLNAERFVGLKTVTGTRDIHIVTKVVPVSVNKIAVKTYSGSPENPREVAVVKHVVRSRGGESVYFRIITAVMQVAWATPVLQGVLFYL
ncbi:hypothetical protein C0J52_26449 [Blattella germanica]|nr:hypothetical protein C0J52_26449 [Blattella germanica]